MRRASWRCSTGWASTECSPTTRTRRWPPERGCSGGVDRGQIAVGHAGGAAALGDRPHDERLPAARVARGEHALARGLERRRGDVATRVELERELLDRPG